MSPNFMLVGKNSSKFTNSPSLTYDSMYDDGLGGTKLKATEKRKLLTPDGWTDTQFSPIYRPDLLSNSVKKMVDWLFP